MTPEPEQQRQTRLQLKSLIDHLFNSALTASVKGRNLLINDVPPGLPAATDQDLMALVLGNLLHTLISHTSDDCIRINASQDGNNATIKLRSRRIMYDTNFALSIDTIQIVAQKMGGSISVEELNDGTIIEVCFDTAVKAA